MMEDTYGEAAHCGGVDDESDAVVLLQSRAARKTEASVASREAPGKTAQPLGDLAGAASEVEGGDQVHTLDADSDSSLTDPDLGVVSFGKASAAVKRLNVTKEQLLDALASLATWYPKLAPFLVKHRQLLLRVAWTGTKPPQGTPEPSQDKLVPASPRFGQADEGSHWLSTLGDCQAAETKCVFPSVGLMLSASGLTFPKGAVKKAVLRILRERKIASTSAAEGAKASGDRGLLGVRTIAQSLGGPGDIMGSPIKLSTFARGVFQELWAGDGLWDVIESLAVELSFWDWVTTLVPMIAKGAGWVLTNGTANLAVAIGVGSDDVMDVVTALVEFGKSCLGESEEEVIKGSNLTWTVGPAVGPGRSPSAARPEGDQGHAPQVVGPARPHSSKGARQVAINGSNVTMLGPSSESKVGVNASNLTWVFGDTRPTSSEEASGGTSANLKSAAQGRAGASDGEKAVASGSGSAAVGDRAAGSRGWERWCKSAWLRKSTTPELLRSACRGTTARSGASQVDPAAT